MSEKKGDYTFDEAYREFHDKTTKRLARMLRVDLDEAEYLATESLITAWSRWDTFEGESRAERASWLFGISLRIGANYARSRQTIKKSVIKADSFMKNMEQFDQSSDYLHAEDYAIGDELQLNLAVAIDELPEIFRIVAARAILYGQTTREIATQCELNESTVRSRLYRARRLLIDVLDVTDPRDTVSRDVTEVKQSDLFYCGSRRQVGNYPDGFVFDPELVAKELDKGPDYEPGLVIWIQGVAL